MKIPRLAVSITCKFIQPLSSSVLNAHGGLLHIHMAQENWEPNVTCNTCLNKQTNKLENTEYSDHCIEHEISSFMQASCAIMTKCNIYHLHNTHYYFRFFLFHWLTFHFSVATQCPTGESQNMLSKMFRDPLPKAFLTARQIFCKY